MNQHPRVGKQDTVVRALYVHRGGVNLFDRVQLDPVCFQESFICSTQEPRPTAVGRRGADAAARGSGKVDAPGVITTSWCQLLVSAKKDSNEVKQPASETAGLQSRENKAAPQCAAFAPRCENKRLNLF